LAAAETTAAAYSSGRFTFCTICFAHHSVCVWWVSVSFLWRMMDHLRSPSRKVCEPFITLLAGYFFTLSLGSPVFLRICANASFRLVNSTPLNSASSLELNSHEYLSLNESQPPRAAFHLLDH